MDAETTTELRTLMLLISENMPESTINRKTQTNGLNIIANIVAKKSCEATPISQEKTAIMSIVQEIASYKTRNTGSCALNVENNSKAKTKEESFAVLSALIDITKKTKSKKLNDIANTAENFFSQFLAEKQFFATENVWHNPLEKMTPTIELWCLAMKPISEKNIAQNVLKWQTGGINVDGCRIGNETITYIKNKVTAQKWKEQDGRTTKIVQNDPPKTSTGRFPANLILSDDQEVFDLFPQTKSTSKHHNTNTPNDRSRENCIQFSKQKHQFNYGQEHNTSASRFFYCAKSSQRERNLGLQNNQKNIHPTCKPIALMQYLIRLISPPNNPTIYDPFMGSGSTGVAATLENVSFIGSEINTDYFNIAQQRINYHNNTHKQQNLL